MWVFLMAIRGRPAKVVTIQQFNKILGFLSGLKFKTKAQEKFWEIDQKKAIDFTDLDTDAELMKLFKTVDRQRNVHEQNVELYKIIQHKATTTVPLTHLEKEILGYDLTDRDGFFNCHKALTTYAKLEKIAKSEIERAESMKRQEAIKNTQEQQTDGQRKRKENERTKYFLGGVVLKYSQFLKDNYLFGPNDSEEAILHHLLEDFIVCNYLSDVTNGNEEKASNVRKTVKNNHLELIEKIKNIAKDIENDKRG